MDDPIIAAIEAHRRACAETSAAYERRNAVEDEIVAGIRVPAGEAESDPQWIAADDAAGEALAVQDDLAVKLLETQPTTIAGAAALLSYYVDAVTTTQPEIVFPELDGNSRPLESKSIDEPRRARRSAKWLLRVRLLNRRTTNWPRTSRRNLDELRLAFHGSLERGRQVACRARLPHRISGI